MPETPELPEAKAVKLPRSIRAAAAVPEKKGPEPRSDADEGCDDSLGGAGSFVILLMLMALAFAPFLCNARWTH